ncbi:L,D-transpeptidase family protein [Solitalea lacus]|uniref:L,D-transpeptidase family protein n=1 Tax=Solitalea lacus TaxID=2911172 RepID=UPI001EDB8125|nr:L,D-transpeptidase family protein [Solitalea lacus]UKJ07816.1 hypothetical protein L2B55_01310 [Solitalea lacus]
MNAQRIDLVKHFNTKQLLIVTSKSLESIEGVLNVYEWDDQKWHLKLEKLPITLGRTGLVWGKGLHDDKLNTGDLKKEGDGKSPAGIYSLGGLFGYETIQTRMDFLKVTNTMFCVDDPSSVYYNKIVDTTQVEKTWNSAEEMRRADVLYKFGIIVNYNTDPIVAGAGSCIFMHIWRGANQPTSGCTAMTEENMLKLLEILDKEKNPLLVQFPLSEQQKLVEIYDLPLIER